jgi:replication factor C subunit 3/5
MEKSTIGCRLILSTTSCTKVIEPLRSRCLMMRVPGPTNDEIISILQAVAKKQSINLPQEMAIRIAESSNRNLRKALLAFEATKVTQYPFAIAQPIQRPDWEVFVTRIAEDILREQTPQR